MKMKNTERPPLASKAKPKLIKQPMTRGEKAAATRRANKIKAAKEAQLRQAEEEADALKAARAARKRKRDYQRRAALAWETRRANLARKGLIIDGQPTKRLKKLRSAIAHKAWASRRSHEIHAEGN